MRHTDTTVELRVDTDYENSVFVSGTLHHEERKITFELPFSCVVTDIAIKGPSLLPWDGDEAYYAFTDIERDLPFIYEEGLSISICFDVGNLFRASEDESVKKGPRIDLEILDKK